MLRFIISLNKYNITLSLIYYEHKVIEHDVFNMQFTYTLSYREIKWLKCYLLSKRKIAK